MQNLVVATNIAWKLIKANGLDPEKIFQQAGIDLALLNRPNARMAASKANNLWTLACEKIKDPCFMVYAGEYWHPSHLGVLGYTWLVCSTLEDALKKLVRYSRVISDSMILSLKKNKTETKIIFNYHKDDALHPGRRILHLSVVIAMCRLNFGADLKPLRAHFVMETPECCNTFNEYFQSDIIFNSKYDCLVFARKDATRKLPSGNTQLAQMHEQIIKTSFDELKKGYITQQVSSQIIEHLSSGEVTNELVAQKLNMSTRSLQRKLKVEGATFRSLLDTARKNLAKEHIKNINVSLEEIAFLTGFSEYSSFSRAFKRWTGSSPGQIRSNSI